MPLIGNFATLAIANAEGEDATPAPAVSLDISHVDDGLVATNNQNHTFNSVDFGAADADRYLLCGVGRSGQSNPAVSGITIGGVSADLFTSRSVTAASVRFGIAKVPTGTSGSVALNFANASTGNGAIAFGLWRILNLGSIAALFDNGSAEVTVPVIPAGGAVFGIASSNSGSTGNQTRRIAGGFATAFTAEFNKPVSVSGHGNTMAFSGISQTFARSPANWNVGVQQRVQSWIVLSP